MAFPPDLQRRFGRLLRGLISPQRNATGQACRHQQGRRAGGSSRRGRAGRPWPPSRLIGGREPHSRGSALVQALMAGLIAVIGTLLLASRLFSSRFNNFSRSDTLAAREAAEYGINELQAQLNTDLYGYLWVTKRDNWSTVSLNALDTCNVEVLNSSGSSVADLPSLPAGITSAKTIKTDANATLSYQLTAFEPPRLQDNSASTAAQEGTCGAGNAAAASNFGNLNGGSAIISVRGTIARGGRTSSFTLRRTVHVASPAENLKYSFVILGNSYNSTCTPASDFYKCTPDPSPISPTTVGLNSDIAKLNVLDGNICYGTASGCSPSNPPEPTVIGCVDLDACIVNNVDTVQSKIRSSYCTQTVKVKKKKKKGVICNNFQQAGDVPPVISLPAGWSWDGGATTAGSRVFLCDPKAVSCEDYDGKNNKNMAFPYYNTKNPPNSLSGLTNASLVYGCFFNGTDGSKTASAAGSTAVNCLFKGKEIKSDGKYDPFISQDRPLIVNTGLLPVNIFFWDSVNPATGKTIAYNFSKAGIQNSDTSESGWARLRILGKSAPARSSDGSIPCDQTTIISANNDDFNSAFVWLPNGALNYQKTDSKDSSYAVIWVCKFTAPVKGSTGYTIITPRNMDALVRENLIRLNLPGFAKAAGGTYRAYGSRDTAL